MAKDENILRTDADPKRSVDTACEFAASDNPADHAVLLRYLNDAAFLDRVDAPADVIRSGPKHLRVAKVIKILRDNPATAVSHPTLVALARPGGAFPAVENRQWLLIYALVPVRPPPPDAIAFWDAQADPNGTWPTDTIYALCDNGTAEAMVLLEKKLASPQFDAIDKIGWMRDPVLRHRNDLPLLDACERMVTRTLPADLRPPLVEALCDYSKGWYYSCDPPKPPPRPAATRPALLVLQRTCQYADANLQLTAEQKAAVKRTGAEVETLLA